MKSPLIHRSIVAALFAAAGSLAVNCSLVETAGNSLIADSRGYRPPRDEDAAKAAGK